MGGSLPLGYDRHPDPLRRELVINPVEADVVQKLFRMYDASANLRTVEIEAERLGLHCKLRPKEKAATSGTAPTEPSLFSRGQLHYLLTNKSYLGRIRHRDKDYAGLHPAIIDQVLWDSVQTKLQSTGARPRGRSEDPAPSRCLMGKLRDETGDLLTPTHTERRGRRYSYYISHRLIGEHSDPDGWRLPAPELEATLRGIVLSHLRHLTEFHAVLVNPDASDVARIIKAGDDLCTRITREPDVIAVLLKRATLYRDHIEVHRDAKKVADAFSVDADNLASGILAFDHPITLRRRGVETRIVAGAFIQAPDRTLIRVLAEARAWAKALKSGTALTELAASTGRSEPYIRLRLPLAFLAPSLQLAILDGHQPPDFSVAKFIATEIPLDWDAQQRLFA